MQTQPHRTEPTHQEKLTARMLEASDAVLSDARTIGPALQALRSQYRIGPSRQLFAGVDDLRPFRLLAFDCIRRMTQEASPARRKAWAQIMVTALSQLPDEELSKT